MVSCTLRNQESANHRPYMYVFPPKDKNKEFYTLQGIAIEIRKIERKLYITDIIGYISV